MRRPAKAVSEMPFLVPLIWPLRLRPPHPQPQTTLSRFPLLTFTLSSWDSHLNYLPLLLQDGRPRPTFPPAAGRYAAAVRC